MIDVAFTAREARPAEVIVVVDVLRATSTIVQALAAGYERVLCADGLERARALARPDRTLAGERRGRRPDGFTLGNSPRETLAPGRRRRELVLATTNGTPAIVRAGALGGEVVIASLLNLGAVAEVVAGAHDVLVLCSGTGGRAALEDVYVAGRLAARCGGPCSDAAAVARATAAAHPSARAAFEASANGRALTDIGLAGDLDWCARESVVDLVPRGRATLDGVVAVAPRRIDQIHMVAPNFSLDVSEYAS
jgi:2-phosphosulfolactate phosphatase